MTAARRGEVVYPSPSLAGLSPASTRARRSSASSSGSTSSSTLITSAREPTGRIVGVPLPRGALGGGVRRAVDVHLPPVGGAPEQVLPNRDRVDATGRQGLVARREQAVADPHTVGGRGDRIAQRLHDAIHEVGADTQQGRDDAEEGEDLARERRGDEARGEQQDEEDEPGAQNRRGEEPKRVHRHDRDRRHRGIELRRDELGDALLDEAAGGRGRGRRIRPLLGAGCAPQDLAAQRVGVRSSTGSRASRCRRCPPR